MGPAHPDVESIAADIRSSWSIAPDVARVLARIALVERRTRILEFGAGASSQVFAAALRAIGGGRLTSLEEAPQWSTEAWAGVRATPGVDALLVPASVRLTLDRRGVYFRYDQEAEISARGPYDLVFIDAPAGAYGRDGGLHAAFESLLPGALVVLDDAGRAREQRTLRRWLLTYPELRLVANDAAYGRGIAVLEKSSDAQRATADARTGLVVWSSGLYDLLRSPWGIHRQRRRKRRAAAGFQASASREKQS